MTLAGNALAAARAGAGVCGGDSRAAGGRPSCGPGEALPAPRGREGFVREGLAPRQPPRAAGAGGRAERGPAAGPGPAAGGDAVTLRRWQGELAFEGFFGLVFTFNLLLIQIPIISKGSTVTVCCRVLPCCSHRLPSRRWAADAHSSLAAPPSTALQKRVLCSRAAPFLWEASAKSRRFNGFQRTCNHSKVIFLFLQPELSLWPFLIYFI